MSLTKATYSMINGAPYNALDYDADPTGTNDCTAAYNAAVAEITASGEPGMLVFPTGTYKFDSPITLDVSLMSVQGINSRFDFTNIATSETAITITGSVGDIYSQIKDVLTGVVIEGPGATGTSIGIYFNAASEPGPAHAALRNVAVTGFNYGISYGSNAYILTFDHCNIYANTRGVQTYVGAGNNSGERITFINSSIFNNTAYGVRVEDSNASVHLIGCSLDYNQQALFINRGALQLTSCFLEFTNPIGGQDPRFLYADGLGGNTVGVMFSDCVFKIGAVTTPTATPVFDVTSTVNLSHSNCYFYLNSNRTEIFKMRTGSFYNEVNAKAQYAGGSFRTLDAGCVYTINSSGQNSVGIKTNQNIYNAIPEYGVYSTVSITDIFTSAFATGNIATSNIIVTEGIYTLYVHTYTGLNSTAIGEYLITRKGTGTAVTTVVANAAVSVAVNGSYNVEVTNTSGGNRTLDCTIVKQAIVNIV